MKHRVACFPPGPAGPAQRPGAAARDAAEPGPSAPEAAAAAQSLGFGVSLGFFLLGRVGSDQRRFPRVRPPVVPVYQFFLGEGFSTKIDYRKKGTLFLTSLLEDLGPYTSVFFCELPIVLRVA